MSCRRCATRRRRCPGRERAALHLARASNDGSLGRARPGAESHPSGEQPPLTWHALQRGGAPGLERDSRARDEVAHRARHEDLAAGGLVSHTSADVYGEAADVVATHLTLARVQPGAHVERSEEHTSELQSLAYLVCR